MKISMLGFLSLLISVNLLDIVDEIILTADDRDAASERIGCYARFEELFEGFRKESDL